jgi:tetratricopeptide (TPR) repeat protein
MADIARLRGDPEVAEQLYEDALTEFRAVGDRRCTASTFKNLATLAAACGQHARSADLFRQGIRGRHDLGDVAGLAECLEGLACSSAAQGRPERAVTLIASARSIRELTGASESPEACGSFDAVLAAARRELGDQRFTGAFDAGLSLEIADAVEYALEPDDDGWVSQAARDGRRATPT